MMIFKIVVVGLLVLFCVKMANALRVECTSVIHIPIDTYAKLSRGLALFKYSIIYFITSELFARFSSYCC